MLNNECEELLPIVLNQALRKADAIIWLQGDRYDRGLKTLNLFNQNWAKIIVISGNNELIGKNERTGEDNISILEMKAWLISMGIKEKDLLVDSESMNTRGQAENVLHLAKQKKWQRIILVASPHHQLRAFASFVRRALEIGWNGKIINQSADLKWQDTPCGRNETCQQVWEEEKFKMNKYKNHIATLLECKKFL